MGKGNHKGLDTAVTEANNQGNHGKTHDPRVNITVQTEKFPVFFVYDGQIFEGKKNKKTAECRGSGADNKCVVGYKRTQAYSDERTESQCKSRAHAENAYAESSVFCRDYAGNDRSCCRTDYADAKSCVKAQSKEHEQGIKGKKQCKGKNVVDESEAHDFFASEKGQQISRNKTACQTAYDHNAR